MNIVFSNHAQIRIIERNISIEEIKSCIKSPDKYQQNDQFVIKATKQIENNKICVVYKKIGNTIIIITSYYI